MNLSDPWLVQIALLPIQAAPSIVEAPAKYGTGSKTVSRACVEAGHAAKQANANRRTEIVRTCLIRFPGSTVTEIGHRTRQSEWVVNDRLKLLKREGAAVKARNGNRVEWSAA